MIMRRLGIAVLAVLTVGGGVLAGRYLSVSDPAPVTSSSMLPTATVVRTTMTDRTEVDGTLGYAGSYTVTAESPGRLTRLPAVGERVERGHSVYDVNGRHVPLFYGETPLWRRLSVGTSHGDDLKVLRSNLKALGYGVDATGSFDSRFKAAVEKWQGSLGVAQTGVVAPGDIVVLPTAIRVTELRASPGLPASGEVLTATSTTRQVELDVPVGSQHLVEENAEVTIDLPGGAQTPGHIASVGSVAKAQSAGQPGEGTESATIAVTVTLDKPDAAGKLDGAPVTVGVAGTVHKNVLAVPVSALLATPGGGYRVRVAGSGGQDREVAVELGIFSEGMVEVSGDLREGMKVRVPAT
jgi:peptidoglycan hydrolase-like protein with peptidoglycan-binding domain